MAALGFFLNFSVSNLLKVFSSYAYLQEVQLGSIFVGLPSKHAIYYKIVVFEG